MQTTLCYIEKDHKYLMLHRTKKENDMNKDKWIGIGGKLEAGETPFDCVIREAKEETGLTLNSVSYRGIIYFKNTFYYDEDMHLFTCSDFSGTLKDCDEGTLEWIDIDDLYNLTLWEGDKIFLEALVKDNRFFELTLNYDKDTLLSYELKYGDD
ncbi:MAG: 8-oxo-dGTP diphosphatase [Clostridia bacterium]|nr:8-oxo-dGTP diphosphatase [Clostridia bacterium]